MKKMILYHLHRSVERFLDFFVLLKIKIKYRNYFIFSTIHALGDSFICLALMKEFRKKHNKKILFLTNKSSILSLVRTFAEVDSSILISDRMHKKIMRNRSNIIKIGKPFSLDIYRKMGDKILFKNMMERSKFLLNLEGDFELGTPKITDNDLKMALDLIDKLNLKNKKIIFFSPFATTINDKALSEVFWSNLAEEFRKINYEVVFNSDDKNFLQYKKVFLPINILIPFVQQCSGVVALRSGLSDVLAGSIPNNMCAIYYYHNTWFKNNEIWYDRIEPALNEDFIYDKNLSHLENYVNICSLSVMYKNNHVEEIIFNGDEGRLINDLIKKTIK